MKKKSLKRISLGLCMILTLSLAACSSKSSNTNSDNSSNTSGSASGSESDTTISTSPEQPADPFGKYDPGITLTTVKTLDSTTTFNTTDPTQKSITENVWATAYEEQLGVTLDYIWTVGTAEEYATKWSTAIASGDIPDVAVVPAKIYQQLLEAGYVEDMTQYYEDYASDRYKEYNELDNGLTKSFMTYDGVLYGLPVTGSVPQNMSMLYIRKDWLEAVNMSEPKTIDELIDVAQAFVDAKLGGDDTYGICISNKVQSGYNDILGFLNGYGAYYNTWMEDDNNLVYSGVKTAEQMKSALSKLQEMYKNGLIKEEFSVEDAATAGEDIAAGKVGISYGYYWGGSLSVKNNMDADANANWEIIAPPTADGSNYVGQVSASPGGYLFVKKGCANPEAVVKMMNLDIKLMEEENSTYGATKDNASIYKYKLSFNASGGNMAEPWVSLSSANAIISVLDGTADEATLTDAQKVTYDSIKLGDRWASFYYGDGGIMQLVGKLKDNNQTLLDADLTLPTETQTTSAENLKTYLETSMLNIIMGDDVSKYDEAIAAWQRGGGDTITQEINEWYETTK